MTIKCYTYPDEWDKCNGKRTLTGVKGLRVNQQTRATFGFSCRTLIGNDTEGTDFGYKLWLVYGATASPSDEEYQTVNDNPNAIEFSYEFNTVPVEVGVQGIKPCAIFEIVSTDFKTTEEQELLSDLEDMLYGTENSSPTLPTIAQVIALLGGTATYKLTMTQGDDTTLSVTRGGTALSNNADIKAGDVLIGLSSTGVHSNGFSLVRKLVQNFDDPFILDGKETGKTIGEMLLTPTRIYVKPVMEVLGKYRKAVHGMVHVTGGGFYENIPRMYPKAKDGKKQLISIIKKDSWSIPPVFGELIKRGADLATIYNTFNMGIGFVLAVNAKQADAIVEMFNANASKYHKDYCPDMKAYVIGRVEYAQGEVKSQKDAVLFED